MSDDEPSQGAMGHAATEGMHAAGDEAISHTRLLAAEGGTKKRQAPVEVLRALAKKCKPQPAFTQVQGKAGKLQCIFCEGQCIPLWPQYVHRTDTAKLFIRVDRNEAWMNELMIRSKKSLARGYEPQQHGEEQKKRPGN